MAVVPSKAFSLFNLRAQLSPGALAADAAATGPQDTDHNMEAVITTMVTLSRSGGEPFTAGDKLQVSVL
jgi:hypothetical protein